MDHNSRGIIAQQTELYGAPLGESVRHIMAALVVSQAAVARTIGVSAPMLSQLASGQRIKLGSPLAVQRLRSLLDLTDQVADGLAHDVVAARIEAISAEHSTTLTTHHRAGAGRHTADGATAVQGVLRAVASGRELTAAADALDPDFPDLAELLRVYGTGTTAEARTHWAGLTHLL